jgi:hypothetical protein
MGLCWLTFYSCVSPRNHHADRRRDFWSTSHTFSAFRVHWRFAFWLRCAAGKTGTVAKFVMSPIVDFHDGVLGLCGVAAQRRAIAKVVTQPELSCIDVGQRQGCAGTDTRCCCEVSVR